MAEKNDDGKKVDRRKFNKGRFKKTEEDRLREQQEIEKIKNPSREPITESQPQNTEPIQQNTTEEIPIMEYNKDNNQGQNTEPTEESGNIQSESAVLDDKIIDPSKLSDEISNASSTPIDKPVKEEEYRNPYRGQGDANTPIPEPVFQAPNMESLQKDLFGEQKKTDENKKAETAKSQGTPMAEKSGLTDALKNDDLRTPQEKNEGAIMAVDALLEGYSELHKVGRWLGQINMDKLNDKFIDDRLDPNTVIPVTETKAVTLREFVEKYNTEVEKAVVLDPEFVAKVRPVMIRVFEKNGWGMSDEMYLMIMFGKDLAEKSIIVYSMKASINGVIKRLEKGHAQMKAELEEAHAKPQQKQPQNNQQQQQRHEETPIFKREEEMMIVTPTEEFTKPPVSESKLSSLVTTDDEEDPEMSKQ